jgi:hypothetical protein
MVWLGLFEYFSRDFGRGSLLILVVVEQVCLILWYVEEPEGERTRPVQVFILPVDAG